MMDIYLSYLDRYLDLDLRHICRQITSHEICDINYGLRRLQHLTHLSQKISVATHLALGSFMLTRKIFQGSGITHRDDSYINIHMTLFLSVAVLHSSKAPKKIDFESLSSLGKNSSVDIFCVTILQERNVKDGVNNEL